jgi:drug/metabolite transporter (DMT)-like permease
VTQASSVDRQTRTSLLANAAAFTAAALFGASLVAVKVTVREIPPLSLAVLRFGQGAIVLFVCILIIRPQLLDVGGARLRFIALLGAIFFSLFPVSFNAGMQFTQASRGALMLATMPIWSVLLARPLAGERLTMRQVLGVFLTFVGVTLVLVERGLSLSGGGRALLGDGLLLLTALFGALYGILAKRAVAETSPFTVVSYAMLFGTLALLPAALLEGLADEIGAIDGRLTALVLFLGIPGGAIAFSLWTAALAGLSPTQVAVYINLNPIVAAILGVLLLSEEPTQVFLIAFAVVLVGVVVVNWGA